MTDVTPDFESISKGRAFPLYWHGEVNHDETRLRLSGIERGNILEHSGIDSSTLKVVQKLYGSHSISSEDVFYYVYGLLHSSEYRDRFATSLTKMLPRIPLTEDFWAFSSAGRELGDLHVGYESVEPWPVIEARTAMPFDVDGQTLPDHVLYRVHKMEWGGSGRNREKSIIVYNNYVTLSDIPLDAYDYVVNGKSAIEWIMERYAVTQDKESKIVNDPNEWSDDPRYIIDLVKRIVRVSMETNRIVASLPPLNERNVEVNPAWQLSFAK